MHTNELLELQTKSNSRATKTLKEQDILDHCIDDIYNIYHHNKKYKRYVIEMLLSAFSEQRDENKHEAITNMVLSLIEDDEKYLQETFISDNDVVRHSDVKHNIKDIIYLILNSVDTSRMNFEVICGGNYLKSTTLKVYMIKVMVRNVTSKIIQSADMYPYICSILPHFEYVCVSDGYELLPNKTLIKIASNKIPRYILDDNDDMNDDHTMKISKAHDLDYAQSIIANVLQCSKYSISKAIICKTILRDAEPFYYHKFISNTIDIIISILNDGDFDIKTIRKYFIIKDETIFISSLYLNEMIYSSASKMFIDEYRSGRAIHKKKVFEDIGCTLQVYFKVEGKSMMYYVWENPSVV